MESIVEKLLLKDIDKSTWKKYRFDQTAKNISERVEPTTTDFEVYIGLEHIDSESIHIKRYGKREDVNGTKLRCYPGDVIFGRRRAYQRKAAIVEFDGFCSAHSLVLRANPEVISPKLFPFFLHSDTFMHRAMDISVGSLSPTINWGDLKKQEFMIPPVDQQEQIAELLWAGDKLIDNEKNLLLKAINTEKSFEKEALPKYRKGIEPELQEGYYVKKLEEITEISGGSTPSRNKSEYWGGDIPWLTPTDVTNHSGITLSETSEFITELGLKNISNKIYPAGTVLYCSRATIGAAVINDVPMATNQGFSNFICKDGIEPHFLYFLLRHITPEIIGLAGGSTFLEVSKSALRAFKVITPPKDKREEIVEKLLQFDSLKNKISNKIEVGKFLQKNLINQIF